MRLTTTSYAVLGLVDLLGEATPYDLKRAIEQSIENFWPVPHTTFYAEPTRLAKGGYLSERQEEGGRRRKHYTLTQAGREALAAWVASPAAAPPELHDELLLKTFLGGDPAAMVAERRAWHEAKLAELQGYLDRHVLAGDPGVKRSLEIGIGYHRGMLAVLEETIG
ncbi:MAG TPA: PadR family transcriptional regulator [Capillimicrobium sp.]|nr:PadR family transcriptional regulator [Capillimicrobium sp.]